MQQSTRALVGVFAALSLAAGCSTTETRPQRVSQAPGTREVPLGTLQPIPGHAPITASGVVEAYNQSNGHLMFKDGRVVQLTSMTTVAGQPAAQAFKRGEIVVVDNVMPVGVFTSAPTPGTAMDPALMGANRPRQRMATVTTVDAPNSFVRLHDGSLVRVTPTTKMLMGASGPTIVLTDVQPGDQIVFVIVENPVAQTTEPPSALPRQTPAMTTTEASEIMIFRMPAR